MPSKKSSAPRRDDAARLFSRPLTHADDMSSGFVQGLHSLALGKERHVLIYVPANYDGVHPAPLALMLHGAGSSAERGIDYLQSLADEFSLFLVAPKSRDVTWDVIMGSYGADVEFIDAVLGHVFEHYSVDASHLALGGFSDGASYALSLGITNGDLFTHLLAFSPGFMVPTAQHGGPQSPRVFISHGTDDRVLPIEICSRKIVPQLQKADYDVTYCEFDGPHTLPTEIAHNALSWFLTPAESDSCRKRPES